jgi:hypothetical protein
MAGGCPAEVDSPAATQAYEERVVAWPRNATNGPELVGVRDVGLPGVRTTTA